MRKFLLSAFMVSSCFLLSCLDNDFIFPDLDLSNGKNRSLIFDAGEIILDNGKDPEDFLLDRYNLSEVIIDRDSIFFKVTYGGGCKEHRLGLAAFNYFMESFPVQAGLILYHDAKNDGFEALITKIIKVDLTPLKDEYIKYYRKDSGTIKLNILVDKKENKIIRLLYNF